MNGVGRRDGRSVTVDDRAPGPSNRRKPRVLGPVRRAGHPPLQDWIESTPPHCIRMAANSPVHSALGEIHCSY